VIDAGLPGPRPGPKSRAEKNQRWRCFRRSTALSSQPRR
jgi:hypothetical protein